ncbi:MAG: GTP cyclohydrolase II [Anaerolineaceae bacterium]|nr:GTP cyclohydrolase II [Anaerolineaceae bacterium]
MTEQNLTLITQCVFPTIYGLFELHLYQRHPDEGDVIVLLMGDISHQESVLVRMHSECLTGDALRSDRCDCGHQLSQAIQMIAAEGAGIILYLRQEGRGIGLPDKIRAYELQDQGYDTVDANILLDHEIDEREYEVAALILHSLRIRKVRLITNNNKKIEALMNAGIDVQERVVVRPHVTAHNLNYLKTKRDRLKHLLDLDHFFPSEQDASESGLVEHKTSRPWITLAYAQTLDGSITSKKGEKLLISGPISLAQTHRLRSLHDGILVGIGTILADDPQLNVRYANGPNPRPIILDSNLRTPISSKILHSGTPPVIICADDVAPERVAQFENLGISVARSVRDQYGLISIHEALSLVYCMGLKRVMVEGGQKVITSFLAHRLVDECVITVAPRFAGGLPVTTSLLPDPFPEMENISLQVLGGDIVIRGRVRTNVLN